MDVIQQMGLPVLGIIAAAAVTFYAVSFSEIREKSFKDLDDFDDDDNGGGYKPSPSSREKRARRKAQKNQRP